MVQVKAQRRLSRKPTGVPNKELRELEWNAPDDQSASRSLLEGSWVPRWKVPEEAEATNANS